MSLTDEKNLTEDVVDINIDGIKRTKFRINGDNDAIIELNLSDLGIMQRLEEGMKKLSEEMSAIANISNDDEDLSEKMKQADQKMREYVDYIFDYPVSAACVKYGTMYSRVFSNTTVQKHQFFGAQLSSQSNSHIHT